MSQHDDLNFLQGLFTGESGGLGGGNRPGDFFFDLLFGQDAPVQRDEGNFGAGRTDPDRRFGEPGSFSRDIKNVVTEGADRGRGVLGNEGDRFGFFNDFRDELTGFFAGERERLGAELPLNPFTDELRSIEQNKLFSVINDQINSLQNQADATLNARGARGGSGQVFGGINERRFGAQSDAFTQLLKDQRDFNLDANVERNKFFGDLDRLEAGLKTGLASDQARGFFEELGIVSGETEGQLASLDQAELTKLTEKLLEDLKSNEFGDSLNAFLEVVLGDADFLKGSSFLFS